METRFAEMAIRAASGRRLEGHAARFGIEARIGSFTEVIAAGAFADSLKSGRDIVALSDHDAAKLLGRTRSGTLEVAEDKDGLAFQLTLPDTTLGRDTLELVQRGDVGGMSFGFTVDRNGETWTETPTGKLRTLRAIELHEISVVQSWPAYDGTSIAARARHPARLILLRRYLETL